MLLALNKAPLLPAEQLKDISSYSDKPAEEVSVAFGAYLAETACMVCLIGLNQILLTHLKRV